MESEELWRKIEHAKKEHLHKITFIDEDGSEIEINIPYGEWDPEYFY